MITTPANIETAFLVSPDAFERIWALHDAWAVGEPHTIILTIPVERRVASIALSIPRADAIQFGRQFELTKIYPSTLA